MLPDAAVPRGHGHDLLRPWISAFWSHGTTEFSGARTRTARPVRGLHDAKERSQPRSVQDADSSFREVLRRTPGALEKSFASLVGKGLCHIDGIEVTRAILLRLSTFYEAQQRVKESSSARNMSDLRPTSLSRRLPST